MSERLQVRLAYWRLRLRSFLHRRCDDALHSWQQTAEASERQLARLRWETEERRVCLIGARGDLASLAAYEAKDGGVWVRHMAAERVKLLDLAIQQTDAALASGEPAGG